MEMEFKDNSRRRTLVLVVGVLLALGAGAAAFMLSNQGSTEPVETIPTHEVVVAAQVINARDTISGDMITVRPVPRDATNTMAFTDPNDVEQRIAAIPILANQPITENMLTRAVGVGEVDILEPNETVGPDTPAYRAVSLTVPNERAVGGLIGPGQRVDIIATLAFPAPVVAEDEAAAPGEPDQGNQQEAEIIYIGGPSSKPMWLDVKVLTHPEGSELYILRMDLQAAEEVALAQNLGAQFSLVLRPELDTREIDRSAFGETQDRLLTRYNFAIPERIDVDQYPQPEAYPSPFPAEPYVVLEPSPSPDLEDDFIEIPVDDAEVAPEDSPAP